MIAPVGSKLVRSVSIWYESVMLFSFEPYDAVLYVNDHERSRKRFRDASQHGSIIRYSFMEEIQGGDKITVSLIRNGEFVAPEGGITIHTALDIEGEVEVEHP